MWLSLGVCSFGVEGGGRLLAWRAKLSHLHIFSTTFALENGGEGGCDGKENGGEESK